MQNYKKLLILQNIHNKLLNNYCKTGRSTILFHTISKRHKRHKRHTSFSQKHTFTETIYIYYYNIIYSIIYKVREFLSFSLSLFCAFSEKLEWRLWRLWRPKYTDSNRQKNISSADAMDFVRLCYRFRLLTLNFKLWWREENSFALRGKITSP